MPPYLFLYRASAAEPHQAYQHTVCRLAAAAAPVLLFWLPASSPPSAQHTCQNNPRSLQRGYQSQACHKQDTAHPYVYPTSPESLSIGPLRPRFIASSADITPTPL